MKGRKQKPHTITLNAAALAVLERASAHRCADTDLVFPGQGRKRLSDVAMTGFLGDLPYTVHGFRSSFRDWAAEEMPDIPDPVAEAALSHVISDKVMAAYKRTELDRKSTRLTPVTNAHLVCRLLLEKKKPRKRQNKHNTDII